MTPARLWLTAANPLRPARNRAEALRAARVGAVALGLSTLQGIVGAPLMLAETRRTLSMMREIMRGSYGEPDPVADAMFEAMLATLPVITIAGIAFSAILSGVLAVVQWRRPNVVIPLIWLALSAAAVLQLLTAPLQVGPLWPALAPSPARLAYAFASYAILIALMAAAVRGASALRRFDAEPR